MNNLNTWERFLDSLSTEGGHIVIWMCGIVLGGIFIKLGIPYGHEVTVGAFAGLGITLKSGARSNNTRLNPPEETK